MQLFYADELSALQEREANSEAMQKWNAAKDSTACVVFSHLTTKS
jgi:hypothetical protein